MTVGDSRWYRNTSGAWLDVPRLPPRLAVCPAPFHWGLLEPGVRKGLRWIFTEQRPVVAGKPSKIQEPMLQGDFCDRRTGWIAIP
jgi:hypothetical protein